MRKIKALLTALVAVLVCALASCHTISEANTYRKWANNGISLSKAHVFEEISYKKLTKMVNKLDENSEVIYVFFGSPENSSSKTNIIVYNEQAIQYEIETVYWVNSYDLSDKTLENIESKLGVKNSDKQGVLWSFKYQKDTDTRIYFDGSKTKFKENSNVENARICFKNVESEF